MVLISWSGSCSVLTNFMASACSVHKAGLGAWGAEHTQLGRDMSFTIYRRSLDAPEAAENSRCKTFLDLWFLIKDLIMSFDIFYSKISPVVSFFSWLNTPCNPTSSDQLSAGSLTLNTYILRWWCMCAWDVHSWESLLTGETDLSSSEFWEELPVLLGVIWSNLKNKAAKERMITPTSCQISSALSYC